MRSSLSLATFLLSIAIPLASADETTVISKTTNWGTWEGFGVSLAWWAAKFGANTNLADLFFTTNTVTYNGASVPGLGLNIVRYNAGATSWNSIEGDSMVESPEIITSRLIEGYWLNWYSQDPSSSSWNWTADANQRNMLQLAAARGATRFELFSNSPMWWMCYNHNPSGSTLGITDNLQSWNYDAHAVYMATIALYAKNNWGITFTSVDPMNEPITPGWIGSIGTQEGCHFGYSTQATVIGNLRTELNNRGLSSMMVSASDENRYDFAIATWLVFSSSTKSHIGRINVHGYSYHDGSRSDLYSLAQSDSKPIWESEYGEGDETGSELAANMILDFRWLHPTAWIYWQAIDAGGWGLVDGDVQGGTLGAISQKYFVMAQFSRHIKEGMEILDGGSDYTVPAYSAAEQKLVIVAVNWNAAQTITFDISAFATPGVNGATVPRWSTMIGSGDQYVSYPSDTTISGGKFSVPFATNQVMTFEVSGVVM